MSAKDKAAIEGMGRRPVRPNIASDVTDSVIGDMVLEGVIHTPISNLFRSPYQVDEDEASEDVERLAESIQSGTLISPIIVRPITNPDMARRVLSLDGDFSGVAYEIIAGHHRVQACVLLGYKEVQCLVRKMTDAAAAIALTSDNNVRKERSDWDRFRSIVMLEKSGACKTSREVANVLGISTTQVSNLRLFSKLPDEALSIVKANPKKFGYRFVYDLAAEGLLDSEPSLVSESFSRLVEDKTKTQAAAVKWIKLKIAERDSKQISRIEHKIEEPGRPPVKIVTNENGATISSKGLDHEKLAKLLQDNIQLLYR